MANPYEMYSSSHLIRTLPNGTNLDQFLQTDIQPSQDFVSLAKMRIDDVVRILHSSSFPYPVAEVFKNGSLGQGTALRGNLSDIDLVIFFADSSVKKITDKTELILTKMLTALQDAQLPGFKFISKDSFRLGIQLEAQGHIFDVDLLPGALFSGRLRNIYRYMYNEKRLHIREHYSVTFAKQQRAFIAKRQTKMKNLFQLMKYWSKLDLKHFGGDKVPSYLMSLIVIHTWEEHGKPKDFEIIIGFKAALTTLVNYDKIEKVWLKYYGNHIWQLFGKPSGPYLIDPANPSVNMLKGHNWDTIVQAARNTLESPLLKYITITSNWQ